MKHMAEKLSTGSPVAYNNRNVSHNGDIIANSNESPMPLNGDFAPNKRKFFAVPQTRRLIRETSPIE